MATLASLTVDLNADTARFESDLGRAQSQAVAFGATVGVVLGSAITGAFDRLVSMTKAAIDAGDEINKMSQKVGVGVETLAAYKIQADLSDVSTTTLKNGLKQLSDNASNASKGTGKAAEAFRAMGIEVKNQDGSLKSTSQLFEEVSGKMGTYEDSAQKTALATAIFGRSGQELIPLMNGMGETADMAKRLGSTMNTETAQAAERFNDNMTLGQLAVQSIAQRIASGLLPTLERMSGNLVKAATDSDFLGKATRVADAGVKLLASSGTVVATVFNSVGQSLGAIGTIITQILQGNFRVAFDVASTRAQDFRAELTGAMESIGTTWGAVGEFVERDAEKTGGKLAAPALKAAEKAAKAMKQIKSDVSDYMAYVNAIESGRNADARERANAYLAAQAALDRGAAIRNQIDESAGASGGDTTAKQMNEELERTAQRYRDISDPVQKYRVELDKIDQLEQAGLLNAHQALDARFDVQNKIQDIGKVTEAGKKSADELTRAFEGWGRRTSRVFADMVVDGKFNFESLRDLGRSVLSEIIEKMIYVNTIKPIVESGSNFLSSAIGNIFRAEGGSVSRGAPYIVGERGPELFVPSHSGAIVPNHLMGGGGPVINATYNLSGPMSRAEVMQAIEAGNRRLRADIIADRENGGPFARAMGAR